VNVAEANVPRVSRAVHRLAIIAPMRPTRLWRLRREGQILEGRRHDPRRAPYSLDGMNSTQDFARGSTMSNAACARSPRSPVGRLLVVLVVSVLAVGGCAQLMADSIEALMKQGIELLTAGKYDEAVGKFLEVIQRDPKSWNAYLYLTRSYIGKASWGDAIASGRKALELAPNRGDVIPALAQAFLGAGTDALSRRQFSEAATHFVDYVKLQPADAQGYLSLGRALLGTGAYGDALHAFVQGLGQNPQSGVRDQLLRGLLDGGGQALSSGNAKAAVDLLKEYVHHDTANPSAYVDLAKAYWQAGSFSDAFAAYRRVLELDPDKAEALKFLEGRR
jgi:tetratricopeptide (TPR) repeat protein